ncbi:MAG: YbhB/YbcL family Raf kinase inhibitor-like protein [Polyangiaceae bacterium]|nr:YbhB/YbcL family Raf kinase inhibitor-like protein [Polyangiaceae bacterium]
MKLTSTAFENEGAIPSKYTCEGNDVAPPLAWTGAPAGTKSFALIVDDPDAPDPRAPKQTWVHWVVYGLPAASKGIAEGGKLPDGAHAGTNDFKHESYGGPCPPVGKHRYFFKLYALDKPIDGDKLHKADLEKAMKGHVLGQAQLMGTYEKEKRKGAASTE